MKMISTGAANNRFAARKAAVVLAAALTAGVAGGPARAQMLVHDPGVLASNEHGFASQLAQTVAAYAKQVAQYVLQLQQYEQMLVRLQNLSNPIPSFNNNFPPLYASDVAQMQCSGSGAPVLGGLLETLTSSFRSPYAEAQRKICEQIVTLQVEKYNTTAEMLNRVNGYASLSQQLESMRNTLGLLSNGDLNSITNQATRNMANLDAEMSNWRSRQAGYDEMLKALQDMQSTLAKHALNGQPSLIGTSIQAAALAAALHINQ